MVKTHKVLQGENLSGIGKKYGVDYKKITGYKSGNPNLIYPGEELTIPDSTPAPNTSTPKGPVYNPSPQAPNMSTPSGPVYTAPPVTPQRPMQAPPMKSNTVTGQNYLDSRQYAGMPADELSIKALYRDRGFEDKYGEWRGTEPQYKAMWMQDLQESINKNNTNVESPKTTTVAPTPPTNPVPGVDDGASVSNAPTLDFIKQTPEDYQKMTGEILDAVGTTDLAKLIQDFSGGDLTTPELEMSKEDRDAQLEGIKAAAAKGLNTIQQNLASRGMTFSGIRTEAEASFAADVLSKESGINREFAGKIIAAARQEQGRREKALKAAEDNYNIALSKMGYVYNPITNTIEKTLEKQRFEKEKDINYPVSYDEWQLAGGLEGTGQTYNQWLNRKEKEDKPLYTEKDFYSSIDKGKTDLQQGEDWGNVWNRIKMQFPNVSNDIIDNALGVSWREPEAYQKWVSKKKDGKEKIKFTMPDGTVVEI